MIRGLCRYICAMKYGLLIVAVMAMVACQPTDNKPVETKREIASAKTEHDAGKKLFYGRCASCHMVNKEMTGPALRGVEERWPDKQKLYAFIRNSEAVINTDKYARELWLRYNQTAMTPHEDLTDNDIEQILAYIRSVSVNE